MVVVWGMTILPEMLSNYALNPTVLHVTALANGSKRRAARPAG